MLYERNRVGLSFLHEAGKGIGYLTESEADKNYRVAGLMLVCMAFGLTSCATMIRGTTEELQLSSNPVGATATLSNGQSCVAPCSLNLPRNASLTVTFSKENCDDQLLSVFPVLAGSGVILGSVIDYGTGTVYSLQPNPVVAALKCRGMTPPALATPAVTPAVAPAVTPVADTLEPRDKR